MLSVYFQVFALLAPMGCGGSTIDYAGHNTHEYFALDGQRSWKYRQEDSSIDWRLEVSKIETVMVENFEIVTLEYSQLDPVLLLHEIQWSSDSSNGIVIHGYKVEGGDSVEFSPPIVVATRQMMMGDIVETTTENGVYASTLIGVESCANDWVTDDWTCLRFSISDGVDNETSPPFVGEWWLAADWGASRFRPAEYAEPWVLSEALWSAGE